MAADTDVRAQLAPAEPAETDIAIVGMAGRFPGAPSADDLWRRVEAGEDCLVELSDEQLLAAGVPKSIFADPSYVRRNGVLDDVEAFDAGFFGVGQRDAAIMDPQHRHFIECCWEALETSGHVPERFAGAIGVFAGCGMNTYFLNNLLTNPTLVEQVGMFLLRHTANDKDFLSTTVSYKLDLRGPSVNVQTACSTSLVAVHLAVQSLLAFECDLALAGGATIEVPHRVGYHYQEGEILSPDGVCRAFDERSAGTVLTSGAGVVALRRLADALEDGDPILGVVKATAINNDGQRKVGYLAPSVDGHADVVKEALAVAGLSGRDIQLLEAHGTGTAVGDPIEVAALTEAFRASTADIGFCRLVSTKPNIGHLDTAAGVASLIKVVQALGHRTLPPLANHTAPSPLLDLTRTPFVISDTAHPWPGDRPRRAGVSSLGVGGTNAHIIVQEAPLPAPVAHSTGEQVLAFSARDAETLSTAAGRLADALEREPDFDLADVAHTLAVGRRVHTHRRVVVAADLPTAVAALRTNDRNRVATTVAPETAPRVAFMFPGGGSQYNGMAAGLDERFEVFHEVMGDGIERVRQRSGIDLAPLLRPDAAPDALIHTPVSLPAIFVTSIALARQWMAWGVNPSTFVGHSLGEYAAAHLAGVLTFDGALDLVVARATLMDRASGEGAAMLAIPMPVGTVADILPEGLSVATVNADDECVVAGPSELIDAFAARVTTDEVTPTRIPLAAAAHSSMLDPILPEFLEVVQGVELAAPQVAYLSNLTGTWITAEQATSPQYWVDHLRNTVRFADCLRTVLADGPVVLMELGPGHSLSSYARRQAVKPVAAIPALRHPNQQIDDTAYSLHAFSRGWAAGIDLRIERFAGPDRRLVRLPGYPFRRDRHWIAPGAGRLAGPSPAPAVAATPARRRPQRVPDLADSFWSPEWIDAQASPPATSPVGPWLVIGAPDDPLVAALPRELTERQETVEVTPSPHPTALSSARSVVLVGPTVAFDDAVDRWLTWGSAAARELGAVTASPTLLAAVTRGATDAGGPAAHPADAMALGVIGTAPREYTDLRTALIDLEPTGSAATAPGEASAVLAELLGGSDRVVARRGLRRMVPFAERVRVEKPTATPFRRGGTYMVTGGLGGVGFALATHLARDHEANLVVVASRPVPEGAERSEWLAHHGYDDATSRRIRRLVELESFGTKVTVVTADLADAGSVRAGLDDAEGLVGRLDGAIHAAGELRDKPIELATREDHDIVVGAKAHGAMVLADELRDRGADLLVLISSTSTLLQADGQAAYVAANAVLDSLAGPHGTLDVRTINFGLWSELGIASTAAHRARLGIEAGTSVVHPVLSEQSVERDGTIRFVGTLATDHHWVVDEHRSSTGVALLPGTGHVELLLAALDLSGVSDTLRDVALLDPLVVPDGKAVAVHVSIGPPEDGQRRWLQIESDGGGGDWRMHSEARLGEAEAVPSGAVPPARPAHARDVDPLARPAAQLELGPRWTSVDHAWQQGDEVVGRLRLAEQFVHELDAWYAHPALVDVATAFGVSLGEQEASLYVPVGYDTVRRDGSLPATPWVVARRQPASTPELLRVDLQLGDDHGALLTVEGLTLRPIADPGALAVADDASVPPSSHRVPPLMALAVEHGIRADEGAELLERVLGSGRPRLVASSLDLADLFALLEPEPAAADAASSVADARPAGGSVVATVRTIWSDLLGVADIGDDDDFFEVGGHSLIAIRLMSRIHKELGVRFQLATIFDAPTIGRLAAKVLEVRPDLDLELAAAHAATPTVVLDGTAASPAAPPLLVATSPVAQPVHQALVTISPVGDRAPLFIVHGAGGNILFLWSLARALAGSRPIYGFQAHGVDGSDMPDPTIEAMAARYVAELRAQHSGPYILGGYSGGGIVTFEMVRQLQAFGDEVRFVVLFDSVPPGGTTVSGPQQLRNLAANVGRHGYEPLKPYIKARVRASLARVIPRFAGRVHQLEADERELGVRDVEGLGFVNLFYYFSAAADRYRMGTIDVDAAVLKAEWVWPVQPHDYYWGRHITGSLDIREVPGDHNAMFLPEHAPRLADVLNDVLDTRGL